MLSNIVLLLGCRRKLLLPPQQHIFKGTDLLLTVPHLSLSTAVIGMPHPLLPHVLFTSVPLASYRLPRLHGSETFNNNIHISFCFPFCHVISLFMVLSVDVLLSSVYLRFCPRTVSPSRSTMVHLSATLLSPHICTVAPWLLTEIVLSSAPTSLGFVFRVCFDIISQRWPVHDRVFHVHQGKSHEHPHIHLAK